MAETRPTGEQLRFVSERTGEHSLDLYLEHAEKGGRVLGDLLDDLFKEDGDFKADMFEFRVDPATLILQSRVGVFADNTSGWVNSNQRLFRHRGEHATATAYERLDTATFNDELYVCQVAHTSTSATPSANFARAFGYRAQVDAMIAAAQTTLDAKVAAAQTAATNANNFAISAGELRDQTLGYRNDAQAAATNAANAANAAALAAASTIGTSATSTTPLPIGTGSKTLAVGTGKGFGDIQFVTITDSAAPTVNWMHGIVTGYSGGNLTVNVTSSSGTGTISSWKVANSGPQGPSAGSLTGAVNEKRATVASHATTADIWGAPGNVIEFTGTANVTAFPAAPQAGASRQLVCSAGITFTPSANLLVPGGLAYTTVANDRVRVLAYTTTQFILAIDYANGPPASGGEVGDIVLTERNPGPKYLPLRQVVLTQASYPALYSQIGLRGNNLAAGWGVPYGRAGSAVYYDKAALGRDGYGYFYFFTGGYILYGPNGATWETGAYSSSNESVTDIAFKADGSLVIMTRNYSSGAVTIYTAPNGSPASNTYRASPGTQNAEGYGRLARVNGVFVCAFPTPSGSSGAYTIVISTSTDGDTWTPRSTSGITVSSNYIRPLIWYYGGRYYIAFGNDIVSSTDLVTWTKTSAPLYLTGDAVVYGDAIFTRSSNTLSRVSADLSGSVAAVNVASNPAGVSLGNFVVLFNEVYLVGVVSGQDALYLVKYDAKSLRYIGATRSADGGGGTPASAVLVASETDNLIYAVFYNGSPRGAQHTPITYNRATQFALPDYGVPSVPAYIKVLT